MSMGFFQSSSPSSIFCGSPSDGTHSLSSSTSSSPSSISDIDDYDERNVTYFSTGSNCHRCHDDPTHRRHPHRYHHIDHHHHWQLPHYESILHSGNYRKNSRGTLFDPFVREEISDEAWHPWHTTTSKTEFGNGSTDLRKSSSNVDYRQLSVRETATDAFRRPLKLPPRLDLAEKRRPSLKTVTHTTTSTTTATSSNTWTSATSAADSSSSSSSSAVITRTRSLLGDVYRFMRRRNGGWSRAPDPKSTSTMHNNYKNNNIVDDGDDPFLRALKVCMNEEAPPNYYYYVQEDLLEDSSRISSTRARDDDDDDYRGRRSSIITPHNYTTGGGGTAANVKNVNVDDQILSLRSRCLPGRSSKRYVHTASASDRDCMVVVDGKLIKGGDPNTSSKETAYGGMKHGDIIISRRRRIKDDAPQEFEQEVMGSSCRKLNQRLRRITSAAVVDVTCGYYTTRTRPPASHFVRFATN